VVTSSKDASIGVGYDKKAADPREGIRGLESAAASARCAVALEAVG
jgi:hypothetical protein